MSERRYFLRGEIDLATAPDLRDELRALIRAGDAHLLVDCSRLSFIDSMGITVLLEINRELEESGRHMLIVNMRSGPRRALEVLGLGDLMRYDRPDTKSANAS